MSRKGPRSIQLKNAHVGLFLVLCGSIFFPSCTQSNAPSTVSTVQIPTTSPQLTPPPEPPKKPQRQELEAQLRGEDVHLVLPWEGGKLSRGYKPLEGQARESRKRIAISNNKAWDRQVPQGIVLHYLATGPEGQIAQAQVRVPEKKLPVLKSPHFEIDKWNYTLDVIDSGESQKRYPIALGANPIRRKFCQDQASTPEGWYEIYNLQPNATYYKAYDIDYPRNIDKVRHQLAIELNLIEETRPIGGEIQIHGKGIQWDWTAGCVALRDTDMDELFTSSAIRPGLSVFISGSQIQPGDKDWLRAPSSEAWKRVQQALKQGGFYSGPIDGQAGNKTTLALGRYQHKNSLPLSCQLDTETRAHFKL